jgi:hypothetical protein
MSMDEAVTPSTEVFSRPQDLPATCSDSKLMDAVHMYLMGYPKREIAETLGITLNNWWRVHLEDLWLKKKGWHFLEECLREEVRKAAHASMVRITHRCFDLIDQRLERGDPIYSLEGEIIGYRAVKVKDLGNLAAQMSAMGIESEKRMSPRQKDETMTRGELAESLRHWLADKRFKEAKEIRVETTN